MPSGDYEEASGTTGASTQMLTSLVVREPSGTLIPNPKDNVAIVIVTYNSASVLEGLLDSLPAGLKGVSRFEVVVCDNASRDGSAELALAHPVKPRVVRTGRNAGYAAGINAATATVNPACNVLILNPDVRLRPGSVRAMLDCMTERSAGVVVPRNLRVDGSVDPTIRREPSILTAWADSLLGGTLATRLGLGEIVEDAGLYERGGIIDWASGSVLLVAAEARRAVGAWDESFFLYSEEVEYQRRVRACGFTIFYVPKAEVVHIGGECHANAALFALLTINRIRYFSRHHGFLSTLAFRLGVAAGEVFRTARGSKHRAALLTALTPLRKSSRAIADARAPG